jgi:hypothetical protein
VTKQDPHHATGGVAACPGYSKRFSSDLRPLVPDTYDLEVFAPQVCYYTRTGKSLIV